MNIVSCSFVTCKYFQKKFSYDILTIVLLCLNCSTREDTTGLCFTQRIKCTFCVKFSGCFVYNFLDFLCTIFWTFCVQFSGFLNTIFWTFCVQFYGLSVYNFLNFMCTVFLTFCVHIKRNNVHNLQVASTYTL